MMCSRQLITIGNLSKSTGITPIDCIAMRTAMYIYTKDHAPYNREASDPSKHAYTINWDNQAVLIFTAGLKDVFKVRFLL